MYAIIDLETDEWDENQTETFEFREFKFGCLRIMDNDTILDSLFFTDISKAIDKLVACYEETKKCLPVYAHNLDFDITHILPYLRDFHFKKIENAKLLQQRCFRKKPIKKRDGTIDYRNEYILDFRNSFALLPFSAKQLGKIVRMPKLDRPPQEDLGSQEFIEYCYRDCDIIWMAMLALCKMLKRIGYDYGIEDLKLTAPAIAMGIFKSENKSYQFMVQGKGTRTRSMNALFEIGTFKHAELGTINYNDYFRRYYVGGRVEVFDFNLSTYGYYLDFNSLYPSVMVDNLYPIPPYNRIRTNGRNPDKFEPQDRIFLYECWVDESTEYIPLVAEKNENLNGKVMFLARKKKALLQPEEYQYLKSREHAIEVEYIYTCSAWKPIFEYLKKFYDVRVQLKAENDPIETLCKLMPNSTYGKFAERTQKSGYRFEPVEKFMDEDGRIYVAPCFHANGKPPKVTGKPNTFNLSANEEFTQQADSPLCFKCKYYHIRGRTATEQCQMPAHQRDLKSWNWSGIHAEIGKMEFRKDQNVILTHINVAFAMRITALARLKLTKALHILTDNNIRIFYCDTDSVVVEEQPLIYQLLDMSEVELGKLKKEETFLLFQAFGCKEYFMSKLKEDFCGMPLAEKLEKAKGISRNSLIQYLREGISYVRPMKTKEALARNVSVTTNVRVEKAHNTFFDKRFVLPNLSTVPYKQFPEYNENKDLITDCLNRLEKVICEEAFF